LKLIECYLYKSVGIEFGQCRRNFAPRLSLLICRYVEQNVLLAQAGLAQLATKIIAVVCIFASSVINPAARDVTLA
jgi:hypothetical protein